MKVIVNKYIPFKGYWMINLFGTIYQREGTKEPGEVDLNHEAIHTAQMKELLYVFFYLLYFFEWLIRWTLNVFDNRIAYKSISFEKEAFANEKNLDYLKNRKKWAMWR